MKRIGTHPSCDAMLPPDWPYAWCKPCGESANCPHGVAAVDCNLCYIESDIAFDIEREGRMF